MDKELQASIRIAERSPYRLSLKVVVAGSAMSAGDLNTSYRLLMECLSFMPSYLPAQRVMGVNRLLAKDFELSLQEFDHLLLLNPSSRIGMFGASMLMCHFGRIKQATDNLLELMDDDIFGKQSRELVFSAYGDEASNHSKTEEYISKIRRERARTAHDMLIELGTGSQNIRLKMTLARQLIERSEKNTAKGILIRWMDSYPHYPELLSLLAELREAEGRHKEALELTQTIYDIQPTYPLDNKSFDNIDRRYTDSGDIPAIEELDGWCESLLTQFANSHVIPTVRKGKDEQPSKPVVSPQPVAVEEEPSEQTEKEAPTPVPEIQFRQEPEVEQEETKAETTEPSDDPDTHQLNRARNILEHARKLLDQTKKQESLKQAEAKQPTETPSEHKHTPPSPVVEEPPEPNLENEAESTQPEPEEDVDFVEFTQPPSREDISLSTDEKPPAKRQDTNQEENDNGDSEDEESVFSGDMPERIVLSTSTTESDYSSEHAWKLLREGSAEEAFFIFSKLVRKHNGGGQ
jgi:tetratricopeptide (TPR) repeat protein